MPDTVTRLRAEWPHLLDAPALRAARAAWVADDPRLAGPELAALLAEAGTSIDPAAERNRLLAALADRAQPGRPHAAVASRILLQALLPAVLGLVREFVTVLPDCAEREAATLTALLECIAAFPRPVDPERIRVAAYLKASARRGVQRELHRGRLAGSPPVRPPHPRAAGTVDPGYTEPGYALAELTSWLDTARSAALIDDLEARLITDTRLHGQRLPEVCAAHRLTIAAARRRRARAEHALRTAA